jgi:hypothetical protein
MNTLNHRICIVIFLLSGLHLLTLSQEIEVTTSKREVLNSSISLNKIIGHDKDNFYVIKYSGTQYFMEKLDNNLNSLIEEPVKLFKGFKTYDLEAVIHFYNELYVFVSQRRFNDITLYYQKLDKGNLQPTSSLIELTTLQFIKGSWPDFHFALSRYETKLLIACRTKLAWSGAQFNEFYVFGENLSLVWKRKDSFEFHGQGPRDNKYIVDETGNVSILSLLKRESVMSLFRDVKNIYAIYRYTNNGNNFKEYPVTLPDKYIRGIKIIGGQQGELICGGLYSELLRVGIRGTFFFKIDPTSGQLFDFSVNGFDEATLKEMAGIKEPMINEEELISYVITDMVLREHGKIIIIAEQVFHQSYNTYNNLIVTCYDTIGQVYWTRVIGKNQYFSYTSIAPTGVDLNDYRSYIRETGFMDQNIENYCSYALMAPLNKTGIILFYNDNIRNLDQTLERKVFSQPKKSYLLALTIDEFGNITKKSLTAWKKKALFPEPMRFYDTLSDTIVIPAFRNRNINYYKIKAVF